MFNNSPLGRYSFPDASADTTAHAEAKKLTGPETPFMEKVQERPLNSVALPLRAKTASDFQLRFGLNVEALRMMPKSLDHLNLDSSIPYKFIPANIAIVGGGLMGVISALKLQSLGHQVALYEENNDICLESSKIPVHCYGAPGYCHLPKDEQAEIFLSGLKFAKLFPQAISMRPTIFALRQNDTTRVTDDPNGRVRSTEDMLAASQLAENEYRKAVDADPRNQVFGPIDQYQKSYTRSDIDRLRDQPKVDSPTTNDEWAGNWAREISIDALSQLKYPVVLVQEPEINMLRFREVAREALGKLGVAVHLGAKVENMTSPDNEKGIRINDKYFDYAVNCAGAKSGVLDDKRKAPSARAIIAKGAGVARLPAPIDTMPQMYIMGNPMLHVSPVSQGAAIINVTKPDCSYVTNGEAHSSKSASQPVITEHMDKTMKSFGDANMLFRTDNMIAELSKLSPRMLGGAAKNWLGGSVVVPAGSSNKRGTEFTSLKTNGMTIIGPKGTSGAGIKNIAEDITRASHFEVHLPLKGNDDLQFKMDPISLAKTAATMGKQLGLPEGMSGVFGEIKIPSAAGFLLPKNAKKLEASSAFDGAYEDIEGVRHIVIGGTDYAKVKSLGRGFGGDASIYQSEAGSQAAVKELFIHRSQAFPGDMDIHPPLNPIAAEKLKKSQREDFLTEKNAFDAITERAVNQYVAHALGSGFIDGRPTIVMPFFNGGSVRDLCKKLETAVAEKIISEGQRRQGALYIMQGILRGMEHLSSILIHRDLKPDNVLIHIDKHDSTSSEFTPKIADFGTSVLGTAAEIPVVTTPQYKSPEYLVAEHKGKGVHTQGQDVWSAGIMLHELLTGRRPFDGNLPEDEQSIYQKIREYASGNGNVHIMLGDNSDEAALVRAMLNPHQTMRVIPAAIVNHAAFSKINVNECRKILTLVHETTL